MEADVYYDEMGKDMRVEPIPADMLEKAQEYHDAMVEAIAATDDDLMMITDGGTIIRTPVADIPTYSRTAGGVIVMRLSDGQKLANFTKVAREPEDEVEDEVEVTEE